MKETIRQMRKRHEKEIKDLQEFCLHKRKSKWIRQVSI